MLHKRLPISREEYENFEKMAINAQYFDPYKALEKETEALWYGAICGTEPFTDKFYSDFEQLAANANYEYYACNDEDVEIVNVSDITNYEDMVKVMTLADENNNNVYIKEPNN